jgi:release factor glutamine methyltransferase
LGQVKVDLETPSALPGNLLERGVPADDPWTPLRVLDWTTGRFAEAGIEPARLEAQLVIGHALGLSRVDLYTRFDQPLGKDELARTRELIKRRLAGEPTAYLIGSQEFWSLPLQVDRRVLIPRRDTETLVEHVLGALPDRAAPIALLDVATGAGPVALALARELAAARVVATDLSAGALEVAAANAAACGLADRVELRQGDLLAPLGAGERFAVIAANLPYIPTADVAGLSPEVQAEPRSALDGGPDGLDLIRRLVAAAPDHLEPGGLLALEHGFDQGDAVRGLLAPPRWTGATTVTDLGGQPRVTSARLASR